MFRLEEKKDIINLINNCSFETSCTQNALIRIQDVGVYATDIIKIPNTTIKSLKSFRPDQLECDIITNFKDPETGLSLEQLVTDTGKLIKTPKYWFCTNHSTQSIYGLPKNNVIVDAYIVSSRVRKELLYMNWTIF